MNFCSDDHDEVCFEGKTCPMCELKLELESVRKEAEELEKTLNKILLKEESTPQSPLDGNFEANL